MYCTETIHPGGRPGTVHHSNLHHVQHQPHQQHHQTTFQLSNGSGHKTITTTINGDTIIEYTATADDKELKSPSSTVSCASSSSSSPPCSSSNSSLYSSSSPSPNPNTVVTSHGVVQNGGGSGASTPHQHFHKKYLREEHVKQLKQVSSSYATPVKQQR